MEQRSGQNIIICSNCGSNAVKMTGNFSTGLLILGFLLILVGVWIPIIGWFILIPLGLILIVSGLIGAILSKKTSFTCQNCNNRFSVDNNTARKHRKAIK